MAVFYKLGCEKEGSGSDQAFHARFIDLVNERCLTKTALTLWGFFRQDMTVISLLAFQFPGSGGFEPFLRSSI